MRIALVAALLAASAAPAAAGFAERDLSRISVDVSGYGGGTFTHRAEPSRLTLMCLDCDAMQAVDVLVGRTGDGTEARLRSGATTAADMERLCKQKEPSCTMSARNVGAAVGVQSVWPMGQSAVATVYLYRDGDLLTIRSLAPDAATATANATRAIETLAPQIVGN